MKVLVLNAFSPTMLPKGGTVRFRDLSEDQAMALVAPGTVNCGGQEGDLSSIDCPGAPETDSCAICGRSWCKGWRPLSAVGHQGTAEIFSAILGVPIPANRVQVTLEVGDLALLGSLNAKLPEGKVLSAKELAEIPIRWLRVERIG